MQWYQYIINTEVLMITEFHMDPFRLFHDMTLLDLQTYVQGMEVQIQKKNEKYSNAKHLATQLYVLRQVLNSIQF